MDRITKIAKRDILELFKNGFDLNENSILFDSNFETYAYNGRMNALEIGNKFQIRHFETDKIPILDRRILEYLYYARCSALLNLTLKFIDEDEH